MRRNVESRMGPRGRIGLGTVALALALTAPPALGETFVIAAMGDSLTAAFNARRFGDNRQLSWSTGDSQAVGSHYRRFAMDLGAQVMAYNEAIVGSVSADLERQTTRVLGRNPDYVTITIGANDVCHWGRSYERKVEHLEHNVKEALRRLVQHNDSIRIYLTPIPDMVRLRELSIRRSGCQLRWDLMNMCAQLLGSAITDDDVAEFRVRLAAANEALGRAASEFPDNVLFDGRIASTPFEWEHISPLDCFHPNVAGQNLIADVTWDSLQKLLGSR